MKKVWKGDYVFWCETDIEEYRVATMFTKEEGTIRWLNELQPGDVLYDVGANIGIYSIYAAKRGAKVYAFEPHVGNAAALLRNVQANGLGDKVVVVTSPLSDYGTYEPFYYASLQSGSSGSQLCNPVSEVGDHFTPFAMELKRSSTLWDVIPDEENAPKYVKIDVDGRELNVLEGMRLAMSHWVQSVQVEIHQASEEAIYAYMNQFAFEFAERHDTANGKAKIAAGADPATVTHNAIFRRRMV